MFFGFIFGLPFMLLSYWSARMLLHGLKDNKRFYDKRILGGSLGLILTIFVGSHCGSYIGYIGSPAIPFVFLQTVAVILAATKDSRGLPQKQKLIVPVIVLFLPVACFTGIVFQNNHNSDESTQVSVLTAVNWVSAYHQRHGVYPASLNDVTADQTAGYNDYPPDYDSELVGFGNQHWLYQRTANGFVIGCWDYPPDFLTGYYNEPDSFPGVLGPRVGIYNSASATYRSGLNRWGPFVPPQAAG